MLLLEEPVHQQVVRHPSSARFHELLMELGDLHDMKQQDYGNNDDPFANVRATQEWGIPAWVGAMIRANDKIVRMKSMFRNGDLMNEAVEDSFRDLAVYAIIGLVLYEQDSNQPEAATDIPDTYTVPMEGSLIQINDAAPQFNSFFGVVTDIEENSMWPYRVQIAPEKTISLARHEFELV